MWIRRYGRGPRSSPPAGLDVSVLHVTFPYTDVLAGLGGGPTAVTGARSVSGGAVHSHHGGGSYARTFGNGGADVGGGRSRDGRQLQRRRGTDLGAASSGTLRRVPQRGQRADGDHHGGAGAGHAHHQRQSGQLSGGAVEHRQRLPRARASRRGRRQRSGAREPLHSATGAQGSGLQRADDRRHHHRPRFSAGVHPGRRDLRQRAHQGERGRGDSRPAVPVPVSRALTGRGVVLVGLLAAACGGGGGGGNEPPGPPTQLVKNGGDAQSWYFNNPLPVQLRVKALDPNKRALPRGGVPWAVTAERGA